MGCGPGLYAKRLHDMGAEVHGIDISEREIEIALRNYPGIDFRVASAEDVPYRKGYFDMVLIAQAFTHFDDMDGALDECSRVLKAGSRLIISDANPVISASNRIKRKPDTYRVFGNYFNEGVVYTTWKRKGRCKVTMPFMHVTYEMLFRLFRNHGFALRNHIDERPLNTRSARTTFKKQYDFTSRVPFFVVFDLVKLSKNGMKEVYPK